MNTSGDYLDRSCVVVGGGGGIGLRVATMVADRAKSVAVIDLPQNRTAGLADHPGIAYHHSDVLDAEHLATTFTEIAEAGAIGNVFVSAGITLPVGIAEVDTAAAQRCLLINVMGGINSIKAALPHLDDDASIVLCASVAAYTGGGYLGGSVYGASKAGVVSLTRGTARELAPRGVRVNCVAPGPTATTMLGDDDTVAQRLTATTLLGRLADPSDIANGVLYLWSSAGRYLTGATLDINGGSHLG